MTMRNVVTGVLSLLLAISPCWAEVAILSMQGAIELALRENYQYLNVISDAEMAELDYEAARSVFKTRFGSRLISDARLGAEVGSSYSMFLTKDNESGSRYSAGYYNNTFGDRSLSELRFSYTLPFFTNPLDKKHLAIDRAQINMSRGERMIEIGTEELVSAVTSAYYRLAMAAREEELARNRILITDTVLSAQKIRHANGELSELELAESNLAIADAGQRLEQASFEFQRQKNQFKLMLGMGIEESININTDVFIEVDESLLTLSVEELELQATSFRTELIAKDEELVMARKLIRAGTRGAIPPMEISLQYALVGDAEQFEDSFQFDDQRVGVGLRMNTDFGQSEQKIKERKLQLRFNKIQREYDYLRGQVALEIRTAFNQCHQAKNRLEYSDMSLAFARKKHEHASILHNRDDLTNMEFLESNQRVADAEQRLLGARVDYILATQELAFASGRYGKQWQD